MKELLAILATIFGVGMSIGYYPQAIKILRNKSCKDVSPWTYILFFPGIIIWLLYGFSLGDLPLIISNLMAVIGCGFVLVSYSIYRKNPKQL